MQYDTTGPVGVDAVHMWWRVDFDTGPDGWVIAGTTKVRFVKPEDIPQPEPEPAPFTQGQCVKTTITRSSANFFVFSDSSANYNTSFLGSQPAGALGTIQGGPVEHPRTGAITRDGRTYMGPVGYDLYYNVDFKNSPDGWIKGRRQNLDKRTFEQSLVASSECGGGTGGGDTTKPVVSITIPTSQETYTSSVTPLTISGTASDNVGVILVSWANDRGGAGLATISSTRWDASVALQTGENKITITATDLAGNQASDILTVTYTTGGGGGGGGEAGSGDLAIRIVIPTGADTYSYESYNNAPLRLTGSMSGTGITEVLWSTDNGQSGAGTMGIARTGWGAQVPLSVGSNLVTITVKDSTEHQASDSLTVTYTSLGSERPGTPCSVTPCGRVVRGTFPSLPITPPYDPNEIRGRDPLPPLDVVNIPRQKENTNSAYNVELTILDAPSSMQPGEQRTINVRVKNTGTQKLLGGGPSYGRYDTLRIDPVIESQVNWGDRDSFGNYRGERGFLPSELLPGAETTIPATITAPVTGKYALRFRLRSVTLGYIGSASNEVIITVGNPNTSSSSCPSGYRVVDLNTQLDFRAYFAHHWVNDSFKAGEQAKKYCVVVDEGLLNELNFVVYNGADDPQGGSWNARIIPPAGSGLQIGLDSSMQYSGYRNTTRILPPAGNYLMEVSSIGDTAGYISPNMNRWDGVDELTKRGTITGQTIDKNGSGIAASVYATSYQYAGGPSQYASASFSARAGTNYTYQFPNLYGGSDESALGGNRPIQYKISTYKPGYTSEYRVNNGAWTSGSSVNVPLPAGGNTTVDWRFTGTAQVLPVANGSRVRVKQSSAITGANVRQKPQVPSVIFGEQPNGALGKVLADPAVTDSLGRKWWKVDFDVRGGVNVDGWVIGSRLQVDPSVAPTPSPTEVMPPTSIGDRVEVVYAELAEVYRDSPIGVQNPTRVGSQPKGTKGTVIDGPARGFADGRIFWKVNFDDSNFDGWVHQAYLKKITGALPTDTTAPEITFASPANGQTVTANTAVFSATITDAGTGVASSTWVLRASNGSTRQGRVTKTAYGWLARKMGTTDDFQIPLFSGTNTMTFKASDNALNTGSGSITITYGSAAGDQTPPIVTIVAPTTASEYTSTVSPLIISGTASDNVGVTQVSWANDRGGSGSPDGITSWSASVPLMSGENVVTIRAKDAANNTGERLLRVTYNPGTADTTPPSIQFTSPQATDGTYTSSASSIVVGAAITDAGTGVASSTWVLSAADGRTTNGTVARTAYGWIAQKSDGSYDVPLFSGTNTMTFKASDSALNTGKVSITILYNPLSLGVGACIRVKGAAGGSANVRSDKLADGRCGAGIDAQSVGAVGKIIGSGSEVCAVASRSRTYWKVNFGGSKPDVDGWVWQDRLEPVAETNCSGISSLSGSSLPLAETLQGLRNSLENLKNMLGQ